MNAFAQPLAQVRRAVLSAHAFRRVAFVNVVFLLLIVATGATVRLTGSGLGCRHWPGCEPGDLLPAQGYHSYVEFGNRVVAAITIFVTLATFGASLFARVGPRLRWLAFATFFGTLLQAPLGAITVYYHLNPYLVLTHFMLSLVVLTLGAWLWVEVAARPEVTVPGWVVAGGTLVWLSACVLVVSGTLATASGPHPGSVVVRRLWSFQPAVYWHVRATAVFGVSFAIGLAWLWRNHVAPHVRAALVVLGLLLAQMTVGEIQYRTQLPWWLVLVHVTLAACVWTSVSIFAIRLWRPRTAN